jgi:hypothetical protein
VPVNDDFFKNMNNAQAAWYQTQIVLDEVEQWELLRDAAEHNAMFMNPEAVKQVRESRENTFEVKDDDFSKILKDSFGREMPDVPEAERVSFKEILQQEEKNKAKIGSYLDMDLDEISFIPY